MALKRLVNWGVDVGPGFTSLSMQITSKEVKANTVRKIITFRLSFRGSQWLGGAFDDSSCSKVGNCGFRREDTNANSPWYRPQLPTLLQLESSKAQVCSSFSANLPHTLKHYLVLLRSISFLVILSKNYLFCVNLYYTVKFNIFIW